MALCWGSVVQTASGLPIIPVVPGGTTPSAMMTAASRGRRYRTALCLHKRKVGSFRWCKIVWNTHTHTHTQWPHTNWRRTILGIWENNLNKDLFLIKANLLQSHFYFWENVFKKRAYPSSLNWYEWMRIRGSSWCILPSPRDKPADLPRRETWTGASVNVSGWKTVMWYTSWNIPDTLISVCRF